MSPVPPEAIARLFQAACRAELLALKPGNVHVFAPGHRMTIRDFEESAAVSAPHIAAAGAPIGRRILEAIRATMAAVGQNTNLGILLLCAPIAVAAERGGDLKANLAAVLSESSIDDARNVFAGITIANPGGLGRVSDQDVAVEPTVTLTQAMALAADRDTIARQYVTGFADLFDHGLPLFQGAETAIGETRAVLLLYFDYASRLLDSHVLRKFGPDVAEEVRTEFAELRGLARNDDQEGLRAFDLRLKARGVNPGTSADLTVATHFLAHVLVYK